MKRGVLIFAYDNELIDYRAMAAWSARNIHRHLDLPVALVTDSPLDDNVFDQVIVCDKKSGNSKNFIDHAQHATWYNQNRADAFNLSPWEHTLLLDADYVVASDRLNLLWQIDRDVIVHRWAHDITGVYDFDGNNHFGRYRMPMYWATVMCFRRSHRIRQMFDIMHMVRTNWQHYRDLYHIGQPAYRNDIALSVALNVLDGHMGTDCSIPWSMASVLPADVLSQIDVDHYRIDFKDSQDRPKYIETRGQDFHAMGKKALGDIVANSR